MNSLRKSLDFVNRKTAGVALAAAALIIAIWALTTVHVALLLVSVATLLVAAYAAVRAHAALERIDRLSVRSERISKRQAEVSEDMNRTVRRALRRARDADSLNAARLDWVSRRIDDSTAFLSETVSSVNAQVAGGRKQMGEHFAQVDDRLTHIAGATVTAASGVDQLEVGRHRLDLRRRIAADLSAVLLLRMNGHLTSLPIWSDWGLAPQVLLEVISLVRTAQPNPVVVELGSGDSTLWIAQTLAQRGNGKLISFEHDETYGGQTRDRLSAAGLAEWVDLRVEPLRSVDIDGESYLWYDSFDDLQGVTILLVDGPPGVTGKLARLPAGPMLLSSLASSAVVILDDADRPDEQEIIKRWTKTVADGRGLRAVRSVDRAMVLEVESV